MCGIQPQTKRHRAGFSLIEILVVVLMVGLLAAGASLYFGGSDPQKELEKNAEHFIALVDHMRDMAALNGEAMGLVLVPPPWAEKAQDEPHWSYRWQRFIEIENEEGQISMGWAEIEGFDPVQLPTDIELFIELEGQLWEWSEGPINTLPLFVVYPTGEVDPLSFALQMAGTDLEIKAQHFQIDQSGDLVWVEQTENFKALLEQFN